MSSIAVGDGFSTKPFPVPMITIVNQTHNDKSILIESVGHPFSFLNSSRDLTGGKHYKKITIPIFRLVLQNFAIPCNFPYILFYRYLFSFRSSGWFVIAVFGSISARKLVKYLESL